MENFNHLLLKRYDNNSLYLTDSILYYLINKGKVVDEIFLNYDKIGVPVFIVVKINDRYFGIKSKWIRKNNRFTWEQPYEVEYVEDVIANWKKI